MTANGTPGLFYSMSSDGRRFTPRMRIPTEGMPRHPQLVLGKAGLVATWDEISDGKEQIVLARAALAATGPRFERQRLEDASAGTHPMIATTDDAVAIVWVRRTSGGTTLRVRSQSIRSRSR